MIVAVPALLLAWAWHAYKTAAERAVCKAKGHDPSWHLGLARAAAFPRKRVVRPMCKRCKADL